MENKNTRTSKQTSIRSTQSIRSTSTSTRAPRMNTAEGIKELSGEIVLLDSKRTGRTIAECKADPSICAAEKALREKLRAFIRERLEMGAGRNRLEMGAGRNRVDGAEGKEPTDEVAAGLVAHDLFDQYCEEIMLAESMHEAPEDYYEMYPTVDEAIEAGDEIMEHCQNVMNLAKWLWRCSNLGMEVL